jgi:hypothetical protein
MKPVHSHQICHFGNRPRRELFIGEYTQADHSDLKLDKKHTLTFPIMQLQTSVCPTEPLAQYCRRGWGRYRRQERREEKGPYSWLGWKLFGASVFELWTLRSLVAVFSHWQNTFHWVNSRINWFWESWFQESKFYIGVVFTW